MVREQKKWFQLFSSNTFKLYHAIISESLGDLRAVRYNEERRKEPLRHVSGLGTQAELDFA